VAKQSKLLWRRYCCCGQAACCASSLVVPRLDFTLHCVCWPQGEDGSDAVREKLGRHTMCESQLVDSGCHALTMWFVDSAYLLVSLHFLQQGRAWVQAVVRGVRLDWAHGRARSCAGERRRRRRRVTSRVVIRLTQSGVVVQPQGCGQDGAQDPGPFQEEQRKRG
jgi:hypothetical protein